MKHMPHLTGIDDQVGGGDGHTVPQVGGGDGHTVPQLGGGDGHTVPQLGGGGSIVLLQSSLLWIIWLKHK